jgi:hypothetical protein
MIKVAKSVADGKFLYVNCMGFKDKAEWDLFYKALCEFRDEWDKKHTRTVVF